MSGALARVVPCPIRGTRLANDGCMFTLTTRMSEALAARPELRRILPAFHPAFGKLAHPILGKVLPRLVTVEDAARVAGVDPGSLLAVLNLPGPPAAAVVLERRDEPTPAWLHGAPVSNLDVRPTLEQGEEPFAAILAGFRSLAAGTVLTVLVPFEPAPLRRLMEDRGWRSHVAWVGDTCHASFWRPPDGGRPPAALDPGTRLVRHEDGWTLDVRGLEPPEPLRLALTALDGGSLPLTILHHREPALLYPRLVERGLTWTVGTHGADVEIRIGR
jgi:hypothetical protein